MSRPRKYSDEERRIRQREAQRRHDQKPENVAKRKARTSTPEFKARANARARERYASEPDLRDKTKGYQDARSRRLGRGGWPVPDGAVCAACGSTENLVMDHCHVTGKLREPLCNKHNLFLGLMESDRAMTEYLLAYADAWAKHHEFTEQPGREG